MCCKFGPKLIFILILEETLYFKLPQNVYSPGKAYTENVF